MQVVHILILALLKTATLGVLLMLISISLAIEPQLHLNPAKLLLPVSSILLSGNIFNLPDSKMLLLDSTSFHSPGIIAQKQINRHIRRNI